MKRKNNKKIYVLIMLTTLIIPEFVSAAQYVVCGNDKHFPYVIADLISTFITIIKIAVPILLVASGMISFFKVTFSSNVEEDLKKAKSKLINSIIAAAVIFFVISIVNFAISLVKGTKNEFMDCVNCFINPDNCEVVDKTDDELNAGFINQPTSSQTNNNSSNNTTNNNSSSNNSSNNNSQNNSSSHKIEVIDGVTYIDNILIVNKTYSLPQNYKPDNANGDNCNECLTPYTLRAFGAMKSAAEATGTGLNLYISSGYRSYNNQQTIYNNYVNNDGQAAADTYSARPGHSEHQTGFAFDLNSIDDSFANTPEGKWVADNCYKHGLIIRYPKGKEHITGYKYEPWHLRYVGVELAEKLYNNGDWITLEEYFGITSSYE